MSLVLRLIVSITKDKVKKSFIVRVKSVFFRELLKIGGPPAGYKYVLELQGMSAGTAVPSSAHANLWRKKK